MDDRLRQNLFDDVTVYVGEAHVAAAKAEGESLVVHAHQMQHGGVQVVDFGAILDHAVTEIVSAAVDGATFHAAAS